ncbi:MAG TPA: aminotransferase class V-fold PLP-dependent enzyme [Planctomycetaceae bacterium]|nr:aminotransferase class V-fold PLP-dependent enzyme [Planctomycetaceae bacterium]
MDTARLGQACPAAMQVQCEFARLAAYDPSLCSIGFLRDGVTAWDEESREQFAALNSWLGIEQLKRHLADAFGVADAERIFLANQTSRLVRIAARTMLRQCRRVLTTDLNWPAWQSIVSDEAMRHGGWIVQVDVANDVLKNAATAADVVDSMAAAFERNSCDGLFIPAVSSLGIRLPVSSLVQRLKQRHELRFVMVDGAQAFCHVPLAEVLESCDVLIAGCHKWLGGYLPMGIAVAGNALTAEQFRCVAESEAVDAFSDPLMHLTEHLRSNRVNRYSETVNVVPMLTANATLAAQTSASATAAGCDRVKEPLEIRRRNARQLGAIMDDTLWKPIHVDDSVGSAIVLAQSIEPSLTLPEPEYLQSMFRQHGISLSAYSDGLLRFSLPATILQQHDMELISQAFRSVGQRLHVD